MLKYILLFVISLVVFLAIKAPASILQPYVTNFNLSGKIINGSAYNSKIGLIKFKFSPIKLLAGKVAFDIDLKKDNNNLLTNIGIDVFLDIIISDTTGSLGVDYIKNLSDKIPDNINMINTRFEIKDLRAVIDNKKTFIPSVLNTNIIAKDIIIVGEKIGSYRINAKIKDGIKTANIEEDENSTFKLKAKLELLGKSVKINGNIIGKNTNAKDLLANFGIGNIINQTFELK